jgi:hypothetical protein
MRQNLGVASYVLNEPAVAAARRLIRARRYVTDSQLLDRTAPERVAD